MSSSIQEEWTRPPSVLVVRRVSGVKAFMMFVASVCMLYADGFWDLFCLFSSREFESAVFTVNDANDML